MPSAPAVRLEATGCVTAFGAAAATHEALLRNEIELQPHAVLGADGGEAVPLALAIGRGCDETAPPNWLPVVRQLLQTLSQDGGGTARRPSCVTSSNFGVGRLYAYRRHGGAAHLAFGTAHARVEWLSRSLAWGT